MSCAMQMNLDEIDQANRFIDEVERMRKRSAGK
jgi:hypothetical protein